MCEPDCSGLRKLRRAASQRSMRRPLDNAAPSEGGSGAKQEAHEQDPHCSLPGGARMSRSFLLALAILPAALSMIFVSNAEASNCSPPVGVSGETVAWAWGWNGFGQLGDGTSDELPHVPVLVQLSGVTTVAGGFAHS